MDAAVDTRSLTDLIAEAVDAASDPKDREIAEQVVAELDEDHLRSLAQEALVHTVRSYLRGLRPPQATALTRSTRWDAVKRDVRSGQLDLNRLEVDTGFARKPLFDCNVDDLTSASDNHLRFAMANEVFAEQYAQLADLLLSRDDARTVRDLPEPLIRKIFDA